MQIQIPIATPPFSKLGKKLESSLRKAIYDHDMLGDVSTLAVALSGGKDSLSLLFLLNAINGRGFKKFNLHAIHISGQFSCGANIDKSFLRAICKRLNIPLMIKQDAQTLQKLNCYSCSRSRRKLLFDAAKDIGANHIAFGHHRDDSIQTLLMNLLHKGEFEPNLPKVYMQEYQVTILRPLIYASEQDLICFAKQHHFFRITCQCPVGQDSKRKKTEALLKKLEEEFPNTRENLARAGQVYSLKKALKI